MYSINILRYIYKSLKVYFLFLAKFCKYTRFIIDLVLKWQQPSWTNHF